MKRTTLLMTWLGSVACLPPAEDAGQIDPTESGDAGGTTASSDESSGTNGVTPPVGADIEATLELGSDHAIVRMIRTQNGVLAAVQSFAPGDIGAEVREYSPSLELLWSVPLPGASVYDLEDLGGGEFLAVGSSATPDGESPTAWRISCCHDPVSQQYPQDPDYAWIIAAEPRGDGLLLAIVSGFQDAVLLQVPLALAPATEVDLVDAIVYDAVLTPQDTVLLRVDGGDGDLFYEVEEDGLHGGTGYGERTILLGKRDDLTFMRFGEGEVAIMPYGGSGSDWVEIPTPGFVASYDEFTADRHERLVIVHGETDVDDVSPLALVEFDDDGTTARTLGIPPVQYERIGLPVVAVGEDQAIYLGTSEHDEGGQGMGYLHRIAPL